MSVLVGCGLGGTSLINANVALQPDPSIFDNECWPTALRSLATSGLLKYYEDARTMLGSKRYPCNGVPLAKLTAFTESARAVGEQAIRPDINVTINAGRNAVGVHQAGCTLCGNCVSGCNYGAKNTVLMNYLPYAKQAAVKPHIFTKVEVQTVSKTVEGKWRVEYKRLGGILPFHRRRAVLADVVILAAGTLGSTAILLRSRQAGLAISETLGKRFSGNGDALGYEYGASVPVNGIGWKRNKHCPPVGPCITGMIDLRMGRSSDTTTCVPHQIVVQEGAMPAALRPLLTVPMAVAAARRHLLIRRGKPGPLSPVDSLRAIGTAWKQVATCRAKRALTQSESYLVMSSHDAGGDIALDGGGIRISWNGRGRRQVIEDNDDLMKALAEPIGATFLEDPLSSTILHRRLITVHPIGGCVMGDDRAKGVVDDQGRVFDPSAVDPRTTYCGLYVADGSIVPRPLGVNPSLTITALAERIAARLIQERGW